MGRSAIADFMREMTPSHSPPEGARLFLGGEVKKPSAVSPWVCSGGPRKGSELLLETMATRGRQRAGQA